MSPLAAYLILSSMLFAIGLAGALARRSAILVLVGIELMLALRRASEARYRRHVRAFLNRHRRR